MRNFILGTDWWTDCDDAVAVRLISRFVNDGKIGLSGVVINACMDYSVASLKGFFNAEGIVDIPIGIDFEATDFGGRPPFQKNLAKKLCPDISNSDAEHGVRLYRRLLANAKEKIEIIEIGFLQVVAALLKSEGDDISEKNGIELVKEKVSKFWVMAGKWDKDGEKEHNFCLNERSRNAGYEFCNLCPVPVTFLGFEVGFDVISAGGCIAHDDHLYGVLSDHGSQNGRYSWDPMLTLLAIIGDEEKAGYSVKTGTASVDKITGANYFKTDENGKHKFVIKEMPDEYYVRAINDIVKS